MMNNYILGILGFLMIFTISSCKRDESAEESIDISKGVFIVNEGNFMSNNGEISFYNSMTGELTNNIYSIKNNGEVLGDVVQSGCIIDSFFLISVNNSKKLIALNLNSFKLNRTFQGIDYPRHIVAGENGRCYVSEGFGKGEVIEIDIKQMSFGDIIEVGSHPENMLYQNRKLFVCNGAWGHDSTITIIDCQTNSIIETLRLSDGTTDICEDTNGNIWVLCQGKTTYDYPEETDSKIICIDSAGYEILHEFKIGTMNDEFYPVRLASDIDRGVIYYIEKEGLYKFKIDTPEDHSLFLEGMYYGFDVDQESGDLYLFSDNGFQGKGSLHIFDMNGNKIAGPLETGIGPNGAVFRN